jgi:hypothetical protein
MPRLIALLSLIAAAAAVSMPAQAEQLSPEQMAAAQQVYLGDAECEFKQAVSLRAVEGRPGHFELRFKKARYLLTPEPTTTGAIRLEDRQAGVVWLQIPAKSMLLNAKLGRREVDGCLHAEQRAETGANTPSIGIAQR